MVEVKTIFGGEIAMALNKFHLRKLLVLYAIFPVLLLIIGLLALFGGELVYGVFLILFGILFFPLVLIVTKILQSNINKSMNIYSTQTINYFRFDENGIYNETTKGDEYKTTGMFSYKTLYRAYETNSHFFMYISKMQAHVLPKKDIISGDALELRQILKSNLPEKSFKFYNIK